jgi:hypothetical protein
LFFIISKMSGIKDFEAASQKEKFFSMLSG